MKEGRHLILSKYSGDFHWVYFSHYAEDRKYAYVRRAGANSLRKVSIDYLYDPDVDHGRYSLSELEPQQMELAL